MFIIFARHIKVNHIFFSKLDHWLKGGSSPALKTATRNVALWRILPSYLNNPNTLTNMNTGDTIWRGYFYAGRCTLNGFIMMAYAPRSCCFSVSPYPVLESSRWFRTKRQHDDTGRSYFYLLHFFVISKLIDRFSEKYVSYLSDVSPARSSHANRVEDSLPLSRARFDAKCTYISVDVSASGMEILFRERPSLNEGNSLSQTHLLSENIASLVKWSTEYRGLKMTMEIIIDDSFVPTNIVYHNNNIKNNWIFAILRAVLHIKMFGISGILSLSLILYFFFHYHIYSLSNKLCLVIFSFMHLKARHVPMIFKLNKIFYINTRWYELYVIYLYILVNILLN